MTRGEAADVTGPGTTALFIMFVTFNNSQEAAEGTLLGKVM